MRPLALSRTPAPEPMQDLDAVMRAEQVDFIQLNYAPNDRARSRYRRKGRRRPVLIPVHGRAVDHRAATIERVCRTPTADAFPQLHRRHRTSPQVPQPTNVTIFARPWNWFASAAENCSFCICVDAALIDDNTGHVNVVARESDHH